MNRVDFADPFSQLRIHSVNLNNKIKAIKVNYLGKPIRLTNRRDMTKKDVEVGVKRNTDQTNKYRKDLSDRMRLKLILHTLEAYI